ncbi:MAG: MFS transporter [Chloroflexi bacterium]|nr:MFS transporter [Chloroflexota bacterium]
MQRASSWRLFSVNACWLGLSFMWNSLHTIILPVLLLQFVAADKKNTMLGLLTGVGLAIAMLIQPIAGAVSDRWRSKIGRRRPMILFGLLFDVVFLTVMALAGGWVALAIGYIGLQVSSNIAHAAMQGLLPDIIPPEQLGRGSAIKTVMDMAALVVASLGMGQMVAPDAVRATGPIALIIGVLVISIGVTVIFVKENSSLLLAKAENTWQAVRATFQVDLKRHRAFAWLIVSRLIFLLGVFGIQAFAQYYIRDTLAVENPVKLTGDLMAAIVVGLVLFSIIAGFLTDRFGSRPVHLIATLLVASGSLLMATAHTEAGVLAFGLIVGSGIGLYLTANWALANKLAPAAEAGKYMGLTNLATAGGGALSRLFGPVIDQLNLAYPHQFLGYTAMFVCSAFFAIAGMIILEIIFRTSLRPVAVGQQVG